MEKTKIDWCDSTRNPVTGCLHGCEYCYARSIANRFKGGNLKKDGTPHMPGVNSEFDVLAEKQMIAILDEPIYKKDRNSLKIAPYPYDFYPTFHRYRLNDYIGKKGRNIFVCSMDDLFGDWVPDSWIEEVFEACKKAPQHNYLFLTKNPRRYMDLYRKGILPEGNNFWFGTTYDHSNQSGNKVNGRMATFKIDGEVIHDAGDFYAPVCPQRRRFVSLEPLLYDIGANIGSIGAEWVIIGAETGRRKGKVIPKKEWIKNILDYCRKEDIPVFMKSSLADIWGEPLIQEFPKSLNGARSRGRRMQSED